MKFNGKELFEMGVPQNKIKFFINREFTSKQEVLDELIPSVKVEKIEGTAWVDWIWVTFTHLPMLIK